MKNTTSGRVYFRSGSEKLPNAFFRRFGRRGLALGDILGVYETGSRNLVSVVIQYDAWLYNFSSVDIPPLVKKPQTEPPRSNPPPEFTPEVKTPQIYPLDQKSPK